MNNFYYYILMSLILETIFIFIISYKIKNKLLPMHGMVISMTFAMNLGLTIGVLIGSIHQGNLFYSTIVSMFIGILVGFVCGISLGLLPTIEGTMSGLMGGMMGAMLGEMIHLPQSSIMLIILLTFSLSSLILFLILPNKVERENQISNWSWFFKPLLIIAILCSYLLYGFHLSKEVVYLDKQKDKGLTGHHDENPNQNTTIRLETVDLLYTPSSFTVKEGQQISLVLDNIDTIEHDFEIRKISIINKSVNSDYSSRSADSIHLHGLPSSESELKFVPLESGIYEFYCTIPGHKEAGMVGIMKVISDKS